MELLQREQEMQRIVIEEQRRLAEIKAPKAAPVKFAPPGSAAFGEPRPEFTYFPEQSKEPKEPKL